MRTLLELSGNLPTSAEGGLTAEAVLQSRERFGANRLTPMPREPLWKKFLEKFDEPIIKILLAAALLSMVVDLFKAEPILGGVGLGLVIALVVGAYAARKGDWVPSVMFVAALVLFLLGLATGHFLVEGMAVMIAVILATGVAFLS